MTRPLRVFLCHSSNDKPTVRELYQKLRAETWIEPWLDEEELYPGQDWNMEIEKAVEAADAIIVCLSKGSITKEGYVQRELRSVLDFADYKPEGTLYIMPVRLEECEPPRRLRSWQYADYFEGQRERALQRLLISLKRRADVLGLITEEIKEEPRKEIPAKPFTKLLEPSALAPKKRKSPPKNGGKVKSDFVIEFSRRLMGVGWIMLLIVILGGFGLNYYFNNPLAPSTLQSPTLAATNTSHPSPPTSVPTPTLGIGSTKISEKDGMVLLYVPKGEFTMGSDNGDDSNKNPEHEVDLAAYWIDQTEVTNAKYAKCVAANQCNAPKDIKSYTHPIYFGNTEFDNYPVIYVDWNMAKAYCSWTNRRLPTEAEWEKAARGQDGNIYPWGSESLNGSFRIDDLLNYNERVGDTTEVGKYPDGKSIYGAYDMAGNVYEWVSSLYQPYPYDANDGREDLTATGSRVLRGGSWSNNYFGYIVNSAYRVWFDPTYTFNYLGFRCSLSP